MFEDVSDFASVNVSIFASTPAANSDGMRFDWSSNGQTVDITDAYEPPLIASNTNGFAISIAPKAQYFRVRYTNGSVPQTNFRLETIYKRVAPATDAHAIPWAGRTVTEGRELPLKQAAINATVVGDNTVVTGVTGHRIRVYGFGFTVSDAVLIGWKSGASVTHIQPMSFAANDHLAISMFPGHWVTTDVGLALVLNLSAAVNVRGSLWYVELPEGAF